MGTKMTQTARAELSHVVRLRYRAARGAEKRRILDVFIAVTGYHHKSAIRALNAEPTAKRDWPVVVRSDCANACKCRVGRQINDLARREPGGFTAWTALLHGWLKIWIEHAQIEEGAVFRRLIGMDQIGGALNPGSIAPTFKRVAQWIGMSARFVVEVSGHSTRVGAAQDLAEFDIELTAIRRDLHLDQSEVALPVPRR
jgi:hypothetical protein